MPVSPHKLSPQLRQELLAEINNLDNAILQDRNRIETNEERRERIIALLESWNIKTPDSGNPKNSISSNGNEPTVSAPAETAPPVPKKKKKGRTYTAAERKHLSDLAKARWAARKKGKTNAKSASTKSHNPAQRFMSAAARKRISEAMKARWANKKKAAA